MALRQNARTSLGGAAQLLLRPQFAGYSSAHSLSAFTKYSLGGHQREVRRAFSENGPYLSRYYRRRFPDHNPKCVPRRLQVQVDVTDIPEAAREFRCMLNDGGAVVV